MGTSRTKNSLKNLGASLGSQFFLIILKFACRTVFINVLGNEYLGINGLFSDILTMLSLTELGLDTAINFKLYKPLAEGDTNRLRILMKFYKYAYFVVGSVIVVIGLCLVPVLPHLIKDYDSLLELGINPILIFLLFLIESASSYLFFAYRSAIIKADQKEYIFSITNLICQTFVNVVQIIILVIWKNFIAYTVIAVMTNILVNLVLARIATRMYPKIFERTSDHISIEEVKDIFKDLGALFIYKINGVVLKATDNLVLSAFVGLSIVGLYSNYLLIYTTIKSVLFKFIGAIKASMGNLFATNDIKKQYEFFQIVNFMVFIIYGTVSVCVAVVADELITCWIGDSFVIAKPFSYLIGIEILFAGIKANLDQVRNVSGAFRQMWYRPLLGIIINLGVSIALVHYIGIYGVIIGTITADITTNFLVDPIIIHKHSLKDYKPVSEYYKLNFGYITVLVGITFVDALVCNWLVLANKWLSLIIHGSICTISVPVVFFILYRKRHEAQYLKNLVFGMFVRH